MCRTLACSESDQIRILHNDRDIRLRSFTPHYRSLVLCLDIPTFRLTGVIRNIKLENSVCLLELGGLVLRGGSVELGLGLRKDLGGTESGDINTAIGRGFGGLGSGATADEFGCSSCNGERVTFFDLGLEDDFVALFPHFGDEGFTRENGSGETDFDILERAIFLVNVLARDTEEAQSMEDGSREPADFPVKLDKSGTFRIYENSGSM